MLIEFTNNWISSPENVKKKIISLQVRLGYSQWFIQKHFPVSEKNCKYIEFSLDFWPCIV